MELETQKFGTERSESAKKQTRSRAYFGMEPLRGGRLANLTEAEAAELRTLRPDEEAKAWAFRFIESVPGVTMTLSGASSLNQLKENIATFEENKPLNEEEKKVILGIAGGMLNEKTLPCTACSSAEMSHSSYRNGSSRRL